MKPQAKGGKMNYEDYDPAENKNNIPEMPAIKEQNQQTINPQTQQNTNPTTNVVKKEIQISQQTKERADACKLFIESKIIHNYLVILYFFKNREIYQT